MHIGIGLTEIQRRSFDCGWSHAQDWSMGYDGKYPSVDRRTQGRYETGVPVIAIM